MSKRRSQRDQRRRGRVIDVIDGVAFIDVTKRGRATQFIGGVRAEPKKRG